MVSHAVIFMNGTYICISAQRLACPHFITSKNQACGCLQRYILAEGTYSISFILGRTIVYIIYSSKNGVYKDSIIQAGVWQRFI